MKPEDFKELNSELELLLGRSPVPASASPEFQNELRRRVLDEFDRAAALPPVETGWRRTFHTGVLVMFHPISRAVAAVAAIAILAVWLIGPHQRQAFGDLLDPIINAKSAKFKMVTKNDVQPKEFTAFGYFLAPDRTRMEITPPDHGEKLISIADFDNGRMLTLMPDKKEAILFEMKGKPANKDMTGNLFGNLRAALAEYRNSKKGELIELGEKELDGRRAFGFRLATSGMVQTLWGDAATGKVLRIESTYSGPPKTEVVMSDFEFDVPLEESLFSIDVPEGYKTTSIPIDATPPSEQYFIASLRKLSDALAGEFPTSLDVPGITKAMVNLLKDKQSKEQMTEPASLSRGLSFAMKLSADADAHYAGKGVKRDGPKTAIFWYKPADSKTYRVIWNDLSASDAEKAPEVPGAIKMVQPKSEPKEE